MFNLWKYNRTFYCFPLSKTIFYSIYSGVYCVKEPADNNNNKNSGASEEGILVGNDPSKILLCVQHQLFLVFLRRYTPSHFLS